MPIQTIDYNWIPCLRENIAASLSSIERVKSAKSYNTLPNRVKDNIDASIRYHMHLQDLFEEMASGKGY